MNEIAQNNKIGCQYDWPKEVRSMLWLISKYFDKSMSETSELAIRVMYDAVKDLRSNDNKIPLDDLIYQLRSAFKEQPELRKTVQETLFSYPSL